ncbi:MAG: hypothetical protein IKI58_04115 [Oscillospiraceae bacterium]|nr:hypothetical protein [Oscillospiraceae bacterium]
MDDIKNIVKIGIDAYKGKLEMYSNDKAQDTLRKALIEANGGSTKLDPRAMRDGKCAGVFSIVEQILAGTVVDALTSNDFFNALVDYRNVADGDQAIFRVQDANLFEVAEVAEGTQAIRRQRLVGEQDVAITPTMHMVRIYEELNRVLAGRVDFNHMIDLVARSFTQKTLNDAYDLWDNATQADLGGANYFPAAGNAFSEATLLTVIEHVEAAAGGATATVIGTKMALRSLIPSIVGADQKNVVDAQGYLGKFYGSPVVAIPQRHKVGTTSFVYDDKTITVIAGAGADSKPIKFVYEGDPIVIAREPKENMDLTYEYLYGERYGLGLVTAGNAGIGKYKFI